MGPDQRSFSWAALFKRGSASLGIQAFGRRDVNGRAVTSGVDGVVPELLRILALRAGEFPQSFVAERGSRSSGCDGGFVSSFRFRTVGRNGPIRQIDVSLGRIERMLAEIALRIEGTPRNGHGRPVSGGQVGPGFAFQLSGRFAEGVSFSGGQSAPAFEGGQEDVKAGAVFELGGEELHTGPIQIGMRRRAAPGDAAAVRLEGGEELAEAGLNSGRQAGSVGVEQQASDFGEGEATVRRADPDVVGILPNELGGRRTCLLIAADKHNPDRPKAR